MKIFEITLFGITFGPTYYALMYIIGFIIAWYFLKKKIKWRNEEEFDTLMLYSILGVILWGRIWYVILYDLGYYLNNISEIISIWKGGMSFHGGLIGVIIWVYMFSRKYNYNLWNILDSIAIIAPIGIGLGRIGNYINNELFWYSWYYWPFAMQKDWISYFPSPLLEMLLEWGVLFVILFILYKKTDFYKRRWLLSGVFLVGYAIARIISEFFRLPDIQIGYLFNTHTITLWMVYSSIILIAGIIIIFLAIKK